MLSLLYSALLPLLALASVAGAAAPCTLLTTAEVRATLGAAQVTARPDPEQDFPSCTYHFAGGALMVQVITPARTFLQGQTLLAFTRSGQFGATRPVAGLAQEAVGSQTGQGGALLIRKANTVLLLLGHSVGPSGRRLNVPGLSTLARRALPRLP